MFAHKNKFGFSGHFLVTLLMVSFSLVIATLSAGPSISRSETLDGFWPAASPKIPQEVVSQVVTHANSSLATSVLIIKPGPEESNDASVSSAGGYWDENSVFGSCGGRLFRAFQQYNLSEIPIGAEIISAKYWGYMHTYCTSENSYTAAFRLLEPFDSATLTWDNQPSADLSVAYGVQLSGTSATPIGYNYWDITELVQFWIDNPGTNHGFVLVGYPEDYSMAIVGYNSEFAEARRPFLEIVYETIMHIDIDVKPGSYPNSINLKSKGVIPVAVLTTEDFDAYNVNPDTCFFAGAVPERWTMEDVDGDGDLDMLFHFRTQELDFNEDSTEATLIGELTDDTAIQGTDSVFIVPKAKEPKPIKYELIIDSYEDDDEEDTYWIDIELLGENSEPVPGLEYWVYSPDGTAVSSGTTDENGRARLRVVGSGTYHITVPDLDEEAWEKVK